MYIVCVSRTNASSYSSFQKVLGQCINSAPVAFLENVKATCVTLLRSCPSGPPLQTQASDLRVQVNNGQGGLFHSLNFVPRSAEIQNFLGLLLTSNVWVTFWGFCSRWCHGGRGGWSGWWLESFCFQRRHLDILRYVKSNSSLLSSVGNDTNLWLFSSRWLSGL